MNLKLLAFFVACMAVAGCNSTLKSEGASCSSSSECAGSLLCLSGYCANYNSNSCPGEYSCGNGYCCDYSHPYYCGGSCYASTPTTSNCSSSTYVTCN